MNYTEKLIELNDLLASIEGRISYLEANRARYGRKASGASYDLYIERERILDEIRSVEYAHGYMQPEEPR